MSIVTPEWLAKFCPGPDSWNGDNIGVPFSRGSYTYATDGRLLIRVPRLAAVPENENAPHAEKVWPKVEAVSFRSLREFTMPDIPLTECEDCDGRGTEHDCPDCTCKCENCDGMGKVREEVAFNVGARDISTRYLRRLLELPEVGIAATDGLVMQFRFAEGDGLLATLNPTHMLNVMGSLLPEATT